jgi:hypothetical protein
MWLNLEKPESLSTKQSKSRQNGQKMTKISAIALKACSPLAVIEVKN